ncbi:MAG TPA: zinc ribbon domain-containing protein [Candidatus Woesebacteria bacterium]|nr:zinc ribbon domain-containing protein [Candidatus Woesebacteria bacterium]HRT39774.1 zinc ribbon domain-containing protein [Candidatus Woesebacteria bacterium]
MPAPKPENFGTNADGSKSEEYCQYCFQSGKFTEPNITMGR